MRSAPERQPPPTLPLRKQSFAMSENAENYRSLLRSSDFIVSPGVYDGYRVRLVESAGFKTAATSGAAISKALLGQPDAGYLGLSENVDHCRHLVNSVNIPITADADNGMRQALVTMREVVESGVPVDRPDMVVSIEDIMEIMGYSEMRAREAHLLHLSAPVVRTASNKP